jgi:hypothetical protein
MPDNPDPEISFKDLPVWHHHPQEECYKRIPLHKLEEQMQLAFKDKMGPFVCFVCGDQHGSPPPAQQGPAQSVQDSS